MDLARQLFTRMIALFRKRKLDAELDDELRFHLEMEEQQNIRNGMDPTEARRQARLRLGGVEQVKEEYRERRGVPFIEGLFQDVRFAFRSLRKSPGLTATALLTLTLGIGIGTTIFSVVNAVLIRPLPYKDPDRLVILQNVRLNGQTQPDETLSISAADFFQWQRRMDVFEGMAAFVETWAPVVTSLDPPERVIVQGCSPGFLSLLGIQPAIGRSFAPDEERQGAPVLLLQHEIWKRLFQSDPGIVGKTVRFASNQPWTVIGVMPRDFTFFSRATDMLNPMQWDEVEGTAGRRSFRVIARLRSGITLEQAQARADLVSKSLDKDKPESDRGWHVRLVPISDIATAEFQPGLLTLLGAVTGVILIMCANLANLLLVKANGRGKELAVRAAMGASRIRLVRLLLTESLLLSGAGCALGLALCSGLLPTLQALVPGRYAAGQYLVQFESIGLDLNVVLFAAVASLCAGMVFGFLPAIRASQQNLNEDLNGVGRGSSTGRSAPRVRNTLAVVQVAASLVLAVGALLMVRSLVKLYDQGPGFRAEGLLHLHVRWPMWAFSESLPGPDAPSQERSEAQTAISMAFWREVFERVGSTPGVKSVSASGAIVSGYVGSRRITIKDRHPRLDAAYATAIGDTVTPNYFHVAGIPLLSGRGFASADRPENPPVVIVNQVAARRFWPGEEPLGKLLKWGDANSPHNWLRVVGVVGDVRFHGMDQPPSPAVYMSTTQDLRYIHGLHLIVRTHGRPTSAIPAVVAAIRDVNKAAVIRDVREVQSFIDESIWERRLALHLLTGLAGLALLLATVGVYGLLSHAVGERTREIGIRMALGAGRAETLVAVLRSGLAIAGRGIALGLLLSASLTHFLHSLLFGVEPLDPITFAISAGVMLASALLASYLPARRATKIDPIVALRCE